MLFAIDIDGTIGCRNIPVLLQACNEKFELGIKPESLENISFDAFLALPEVVARSDERFDKQLRWMDFDHDVLVAAKAIAGAVEGVRQLAELAPVAYYTARFSPTSEEKSKAMARATHTWLEAQGFPNADRVVFCSSVRDKLTRLAELDQDVILIDDYLSKILIEFQKLDQEIATKLRQRLTLVAFKAKEPPTECHGLSVVPLPNWRCIDNLLSFV